MYKFFDLAFKKGWLDDVHLRMAVKTEGSTIGEITENEYKQITGKEY